MTLEKTPRKLRLTTVMRLFIDVTIIAFSISRVEGIRDDRKKEGYVKRGLQGQKNWKQNDKYNKNMGKNYNIPSAVPSNAPSMNPTDSPAPSPSPSSTPTLSSKPSETEDTLSPTSSPPTIEPTASPTTSPTMQPTTVPTRSPTRKPSFSPSISQRPSISNVLGYITVSFSLYNEEGNTLNKVELVQSRSSDIRDNIILTLCHSAKFLLFDQNEMVCPSQDKIENIFGKFSKLRVDQTRVTVEIQTKENNSYSVWQLSFPVVQIGEIYQMEQEDALRLVEVEAQASITAKIEDGSMDSELQGKFSAVGSEEEKWNLTISNLTSINSSTSNLRPIVWTPVELEPFDPLRVLGMGMFVVTAVIAWFIMHMSHKRRMEREWDADFKERGKGGLVTEEGVDYMLAAGRKQSQQHLSTSDRDNEETNKLPLPGYMNVELFGVQGANEYSSNEQRLQQKYGNGSQFSSSHISID